MSKILVTRKARNFIQDVLIRPQVRPVAQGAFAGEGGISQDLELGQFNMFVRLVPQESKLAPGVLEHHLVMAISVTPKFDRPELFDLGEPLMVTVEQRLPELPAANPATFGDELAKIITPYVDTMLDQFYGLLERFELTEPAPSAIVLS